MTEAVSLFAASKNPPTENLLAGCYKSCKPLPDEFVLTGWLWSENVWDSPKIRRRIFVPSPRPAGSRRAEHHDVHGPVGRSGWRHCCRGDRSVALEATEGQHRTARMKPSLQSPLEQNVRLSDGQDVVWAGAIYSGAFSGV